MVCAPGSRWPDRVEAGLMALRHNPQTRKTTMMTTKDKVARRKLLNRPGFAGGDVLP